VATRKERIKSAAHDAAPKWSLLGQCDAQCLDVVRQLRAVAGVADKTPRHKICIFLAFYCLALVRACAELGQAVLGVRRFGAQSGTVGGLGKGLWWIN
jgi:hypothetical protein